MLRPSLFGIVFCGLILSGIPLLAVARHSHVEATQIRFTVPATLSARVDGTYVNIWSDINELDVSELSGTDSVQRGDIVYVSMARGPHQIAYPFALTQNRTNMPDVDEAFTVKGLVTARTENRLLVRYSFETFAPLPDLAKAMQVTPTTDGEIELVMNSRSVPRIHSVTVAGVTYDHRVMDEPLLKAFTR